MTGFLNPALFSGTQPLNPVASSSSLNVTAAAVVKASPGRIYSIFVIATGTTGQGSLTLNDCTTTGAAAAANELFTWTAAQMISLIALANGPLLLNLPYGIPFNTGLVVSAVPSAGSPQYNVFYS